MLIILHGAKPLNQILSQEARVNGNNFGPELEKKTNKEYHFGEHMLATQSN